MIVPSRDHLSQVFSRLTRRCAALLARVSRPAPSSPPAPSASAPAASAPVAVPARRGVAGALAIVLVVALGAVAMVGIARITRPTTTGTWRSVDVAAPASPQPSPSELPPVPATAPADLPVVDYGPAPAGFPADPTPLSTEPLAAGAHPVTTIPAYDGFGGRPRAFLAPTISGVQVTMPIVERRAGWAAVLLPSANRTVAWLGPGGWDEVTLRDHLVVRRATHQMAWYRDGALQQSWTVTLGHPKTPTPLGRTFILGRSALPGEVYAGLDVWALGAVPDDVEAIPAGLRGAHIGIHAWYRDDAYGKDASDGCIRLPRPGQQLLLAEVPAGTEVVVVD